MCIKVSTKGHDEGCVQESIWKCDISNVPNSV